HRLLRLHGLPEAVPQTHGCRDGQTDRLLQFRKSAVSAWLHAPPLPEPEPEEVALRVRHRLRERRALRLTCLPPASRSPSRFSMISCWRTSAVARPPCAFRLDLRSAQSSSCCASAT